MTLLSYTLGVFWVVAMLVLAYCFVQLAIMIYNDWKGPGE